MSYSAQITADYRKYTREFGATISIEEYTEIFWRRKTDSKIKIPKAMEAAFAEPANDAERNIKIAIDEFNAQEATRLEQELFKQGKRLTNAERTHQGKLCCGRTPMATMIAAKELYDPKATELI